MKLESAYIGEWMFGVGEVPEGDAERRSVVGLEGRWSVSNTCNQDYSSLTSLLRAAATAAFLYFMNVLWKNAFMYAT